MSPASAAIIFGGAASVLLYFFECWIDGHLTKNMLAAGAFVAMMQRIGTVWWGGDGEIPPAPDLTPLVAQARADALHAAATTVREHPGEDRQVVAGFIDRLAR